MGVIKISSLVIYYHAVFVDLNHHSNNYYVIASCYQQQSQLQSLLFCCVNIQL